MKFSTSMMHIHIFILHELLVLTTHRQKKTPLVECEELVSVLIEIASQVQNTLKIDVCGKTVLFALNILQYCMWKKIVL